MQPGVYRITCGDTTIIASTILDHQELLENGVHPHDGLQAEYDRTLEFGATLLMEVPRKHDDSDHVHHERQANGVTVIEDTGLRDLWQDPDFRAAQIERLRGRTLGETTRARMSEAKRGDRNPNATPCEVGGVRYPCVSDAARAIGVSQQALQQWLTGATPWPGTGLRKSRRPDLEGLTGRFV